MTSLSAVRESVTEPASTSWITWSVGPSPSGVSTRRAKNVAVPSDAAAASAAEPSRPPTATRAAVTHPAVLDGTAQHVVQVVGDRLLQLGEGAVAGLLVRPPADELRRVPEPGSLHVVIAHLDDPLRTQWNEGE